jgi:hypothetical protein
VQGPLGTSEDLLQASCGPFLGPGGRETIFSETHTNEFCGIEKLAQKPAGPCVALRPGRSVCEESRQEKKQPPLWGGCPGRPGHLSTAAFAGSFSPISSVAALAWCPTVCRGTDDCGEHHPSPVAALAVLTAWRARHLGRLLPGAREYPVCAEGWALWALGGSPDLYKATGGTYRLGMPQG